MSKKLNLDVRFFVETGSFFFQKALDFADTLNDIKRCADSLFDGNSIIYGFPRSFYTVEFIVTDDERGRIVLHEQVLFNIYMMKQKTVSRYIKRIRTLSSFLRIYASYIEDIYQDETETVVFMANGNNVYFVSITGHWLLTKIISKHDATRQLVRKVLPKVPLPYLR